MNFIPKKSIILTLPHLKCSNDQSDTTPHHNCDTIIEKVANIMSKILLNDKREIVIFWGDINRNISDLNRIESRGTDFDAQLEAYVETTIKEINNQNIKNSNNIIYIIDCHSFPSTKTDNEGHFRNIRINNPDVAILMADCLQLDYAEELYEILKENNISVTKHLGKGNYIIEKYYAYGRQLTKNNSLAIIIPILIEFNEDLSDAKITIICQCIEKWIVSIDAYLSNNILNGGKNDAYYYKYMKYKKKYIDLKKYT